MIPAAVILSFPLNFNRTIYTQSEQLKKHLELDWCHGKSLVKRLEVEINTEGNNDTSSVGGENQ